MAQYASRTDRVIGCVCVCVGCSAIQLRLVCDGLMHYDALPFWCHKLFKWIHPLADAFECAVALLNQYEVAGNVPGVRTSVAYALASPASPA